MASAPGLSRRSRQDGAVPDYRGWPGQAGTSPAMTEWELPRVLPLLRTCPTRAGPQSQDRISFRDRLRDAQSVRRPYPSLRAGRAKEGAEIPREEEAMNAGKT